MTGIDNLETFEKDTLLRWFLYYLSEEQRRDLMHEYPLIYNNLCQRRVMGVQNLTQPNSWMLVPRAVTWDG